MDMKGNLKKMFFLKSRKKIKGSSLCIREGSRILLCSTWRRVHGLCVGVCSVQLQSCPTLCDTLDYILPGSSLPGILQARILEWAAHPLLQGTFPTQRSNLHLLCLLHRQVGSLPLLSPGKPTRPPAGAQLADRLKQWLMSERIWQSPSRH